MMTLKKLSFLILAAVLLVSCHRTPATLADVESQYITHDGVRIHYKTCGHGRQTIVFIHGLGCDLNTWGAQYQAFADNPDIELIFIDLPGYGLSDKPENYGYTLTDFAGAVQDVLDEVRLHDPQPVILVGHSLGTAVCRQFCFDYPSQVQGLVDVDGVYVLLPADSAGQAEYMDQMQQFAAGFCGGDVRQYFQDFVSALAGPDTPDSITRYALSTMPATMPYVACATMSHLIDLSYWTGAPISAPTKVICTQNSGLFPDNRERMQALYPNLSYTELATCGHFIHMEQPRIVNNSISQLLGGR